MSTNYRYYAEKVAEARGRRTGDHPLQKEIEELFAVVRECEAMWALEERIEHAETAGPTAGRALLQAARRYISSIRFR